MKTDEIYKSIIEEEPKHFPFLEIRTGKLFWNGKETTEINETLNIISENLIILSKQIVYKKTVNDSKIVEKIFQIIFDEYGFTEKQLQSKSRQKELSFARTICGSLIKNNTKYTFTKSGYFVKRNHSTIMYYCIIIKTTYFAKEYFRLEKIIKT